MGRPVITVSSAEEARCLFKSVSQGAGHVLLAGDIGEALGTIFAGENLVSHREDFRLAAAQAGRPANRLQL